MEEKEIKASELLFNINEKVNEMHQMLQNLQFNYSIILNRLPASINPSSQVSNILPIIQTPLPSEEEEIKFTPIEKVNNFTKTRLVRQQVFAQDGKTPIIFALVKIYSQDIKTADKKKCLISDKNRTDARGFWSHKLSPGTYWIHIFKKGLGDNQIDYYNCIKVDPGDEVLQIDSVSQNSVV